MLASRPVVSGPAGEFKTPGRALKTQTRGLLENKHQHAGAFSVRVGGAAKKAGLPKTPYQPSTLQSHRSLKDAKDSKPTVLFTTVPKPLLDKTPFPNRVAPGPPTLGDGASKLAQPNLYPPSGGVLPSSTRKHPRRPSFPSAQALGFETPATQGNHWDVSDGSIIMNGVGRDVSMAESSIDEEDDEEIEYMPPTAVDRPYEPPFPLPDFKALGAALRSVAHSYPVPPDEGKVPSPEFEFEFDPTEIKIEKLELPILEDDLAADLGFKRAPSSQPAPVLPTKPKTIPAPLHKRTASVPVPVSRAVSIGPKPPGAAGKRPLTTVTQKSSFTSAAQSRAPPPTSSLPSATRTTTAIPPSRAHSRAGSSTITTTRTLPARPATAIGSARPLATAKVASTASRSATAARPVPSRDASTAASKPQVARARAATATTSNRDKTTVGGSTSGVAKAKTATAQAAEKSLAKDEDDDIGLIFEECWEEEGEDFKFGV